MRLFVAVVFAIVSVSTAQHQQVDPAYLRQYYAQLAQQGGQQGSPRAATPIFEQQEQQQPQQFQPAPARTYQKPAQIFVPEQQQPRQYQPQPQQVQYQQPKAQPRPNKPVYRQEEQESREEDYDPSPSYQFGFDVKDDEFTNYQNRKESRDGNVIKGSYSVVDSDGFIRTVTYTADPKEGFKAEVVREPTDIVIKVPTPAPQTQQQQHGQLFRSNQPKPQQQQQQYDQQPPQQYRQQHAQQHYQQ
ncbi:cuticle protein 21 [Chironomus tepperi]|uniref:cuticle protein 21 n=1 Tax=Chironomus tepperi TaxID=113505 RepID=UPI00391F3682